jgi:ribosomal protein S18 acetylase RimI-like enzyme
MRIREARVELPDGRPVEIRSARPGEAGALLDHLARVHAAEPRANPAPDYTADSLRALIAELRDAPAGALLVAVAGDAVVASLAARPTAAGEAEVGISVHPAWRRQGIAARLLRTLFAAAPPRLTLEVAPGNAPALALFRSVGFRDTGERRAGLLRMERS